MQAPEDNPNPQLSNKRKKQDMQAPEEHPNPQLSNKRIKQDMQDANRQNWSNKLQDILLDSRRASTSGTTRHPAPSTSSVVPEKLPSGEDKMMAVSEHGSDTEKDK